MLAPYRFLQERGKYMDRRKVIRENIFRILFRIEFNDQEEMEEQMNLYLDGLEDTESIDNIEEQEIALIREKTKAVLKKQSLIDEKISMVSDGWTIDRIGKTELAIMRLAVYEMCFDENIPEKVAINEAVELSKIYCDEEAKGFINAVLGKLARQGDL